MTNPAPPYHPTGVFKRDPEPIAVYQTIPVLPPDRDRMELTIYESAGTMLRVTIERVKPAQTT